MKEAVSVTPYHSDLGIDHEEELAVLGGGHMGADIALQTDIACEYKTIHIVDIVQEQLDKARKHLLEFYHQKAFKKYRDHEKAATEAEGYVNNRYDFILADPAAGVYEGLESTSLIIEAGPETKKEAIYKTLANSELKPDVTIATNTSAELIHKIEDFAGESFIDKIVASHFYTYVLTNPLIDVATPRITDEPVLGNMLHIADKMNKKAITQRYTNYSFPGSIFFEAAAAIAVDLVDSGEKIEEVDRMFEALGFREGPLKSLDRTQHFAYNGCGIVLGMRLPNDDRTKALYEDNSHMKPFMNMFLESGNTGLESERGKGFYQWSKPGDIRARPVKAYRPDADAYTDIELPPDEVMEEIEKEDQESGYYRTIHGIIKLLNSDTETGKKARRIAIPLINEQMDLVNKCVITPGQAYTTVRLGLVSKLSLEVFDKMGKEAYLEAVEKAKEENPERPELYEPDERFHLEEKFLEYGELFDTPVSTYNSIDADSHLHPGWEIKRYTELIFEKNIKDGVAVLTLHNPAKRNPLTMALLDQMSDAISDIEEDDRIESVVIATSGEDMTGAGANIFEFMHGKYKRGEPVNFSVKKSLGLSEGGRKLFERLRKSGKFTVGAVGNAFGGTAEMMYYLDSIAMKNGSRFDQTEFYKLGIGDGIAAYANLKDKIGEDAAMSVCLGQGLDEETAHNLGLVDGIGENRLDTVRKAYEMAKRAAKGKDVRKELAQDRASRDRSSVKFRTIDMMPGDSITEKAKELKMSPQALKRLLQKRDHYSDKKGIDNEFESQTIKEMFTEPNAVEGMSALLEGRKPDYDYSEKITYQSENLPSSLPL